MSAALLRSDRRVGTIKEAADRRRALGSLKLYRVNIGGTVIVTETGCEELNEIPTRVTHKQ
ncbi:MAG: hypothetical protein JO128_01675 [Alphaproteobacteria bacterium]|nr:hypothetical protein [Alphaproteobacteria bacterium]